MHKDFYASGFLYHPRTQQILLQQNNSKEDKNEWTLICGEFNKDDDFKEAYLKIIEDNLNLKLKTRAVNTVYDYTNKGKNIYIFYATVSKLEKFNEGDKIFAWFTFKQISKLGLSEQVKQDIIVGQRVISSSIRKDMGLRTIG